MCAAWIPPANTDLYSSGAIERNLQISAKRQENRKAVGFAPIARRDARILVLGSLPGERSIRAGQYYAHPQNTFWRIMGELVGAAGSYEQRCAALCRARIALWDVLRRSIRPGSMDADIRTESAEPNDFRSFFEAHRAIDVVCFNGRKAEQMFHRFVKLQAHPRFVLLPSTSPAYASMRFEQKLDTWRRAITGNGEDQE